MTDPMRRRLRVLAYTGGLALVGAATIVACGSSTPPATETPTTTTTTTTTTAPLTPTEKSLDPRGGNLFTPDHRADPPPTEPPGVHRNN